MLNMKIVAFLVASMIVCTTAIPQPHKFGLGAVSVISVPRYYPVVQTVNVVEPIVPLAPVYPVYPVIGRFG